MTGRGAWVLPTMLLCSPAWAETKVLVFASNEGLASDPPLSFAESDAAAVADTLVDVGAVTEDKVVRLLGRGSAAVAHALTRLQNEAGPEDAVIVFASGHGDERGIHLGDNILSWHDFRHHLDAMRSRIVIAFVDTCQSGALLTAKGFERGPPLSVSVAPAGPRGRVLSLRAVPTRRLWSRR